MLITVGRNRRAFLLHQLWLGHQLQGLDPGDLDHQRVHERRCKQQKHGKVVHIFYELWPRDVNGIPKDYLFWENQHEEHLLRKVEGRYGSCPVFAMELTVIFQCSPNQDVIRVMN